MLNLLSLARCKGLLVSILVMGFTQFALAQDADTPDPLQGYNRAMFAFNEKADKFVVRPLARGYKSIVPNPLERGVKNIFDNLLEIPSATNSLLQGNFQTAGYDTGRFLVNSTLGIGGLLDVAKYMNLPAKDHEDFGQTLAVWGVGSGPYLVLPILGPSTVRDGLARPVDWYTDPAAYIDHVRTYNTVVGLRLLSARAQLIPLEKNITGDRYTFIRDVYLQRREFLINNGDVVDDFGADEFSEDDF